MNGKGELLVGCSGGSADFNDAGLNGFANGHKFDLMLVFQFNSFMTEVRIESICTAN